MRIRSLCRLASWGGVWALVVGPTLVLAQDGQPPTGPPVTTPRTNKALVDESRPVTDNPPPSSTTELTPVPATAADPAPPGTRGVRVDIPAVPPGAVAAPVPGANPNAMPGRGTNRRLADVRTIEGVVTRISKPGTDVPEERIRITIDPDQDWVSYVERGPLGLAKHADRKGRSDRASTGTSKKTRPISQPTTARAGRDADESRDRDRDDANKSSDSSSSRPKGAEVVVAHRTYIFTFARSPEGYDLMGVDTPSSPDVQRSRSGSTIRPVVPTAAPKPASFTNIKEGSYVSVRFRKVNGVNEALNLSLIELPTNPTPPTAATSLQGGPTPMGGLTTGTGKPLGGPATVPGTRTTTAPATGAAATPPATTPPVRVPVVPTAPTAPAVGPQ